MLAHTRAIHYPGGTVFLGFQALESCEDSARERHVRESELLEQAQITNTRWNTPVKPIECKVKFLHPGTAAGRSRQG